MKASEKLRDISRSLAGYGIDPAGREAEFILRSVLGLDLAGLYRDDPELTEGQIASIGEFVSRRINREPLQYIVGHVDFLGLRLRVGPGVLIPRPETELLAEHAIKMMRDCRLRLRDAWRSYADDTVPPTPPADGEPPMKVLDLCTGSGCLALALAKAFQQAEVYGTDISETALRYARENAAENSTGNVIFLKGSLFDPLAGRPGSSVLFDLIISNPPYVRTEDIGTLQPEVRMWEPLSALDGGSDGLDHYRVIIPAARGYLKQGGMIMFELGIGCSDGVADMLQRSGYTDITITNDYAGIGRIAAAIYTGQDTRSASRSTET